MFGGSVCHSDGTWALVGGQGAYRNPELFAGCITGRGKGIGQAKKHEDWRKKVVDRGAQGCTDARH